MKNINVLDLILNLEHMASAAYDVIKNWEIIIQTVLYNGTSKETYVETRLRLYNKQKTKNSISLPPDPLSCKQVITSYNVERVIRRITGFVVPIKCFFNFH